MKPMNHRTFLQTATLGATALAGLSWTSALAAEKTNWPIGCFNRPWTQWSYNDALDGIKDAGYKLTGLLSVHRGEAFTLSAATPEYLDGLKKRSAQRGLAVNMSAIRFRPDAPLAENIADLRQQTENAARLEVKFMLTFGVDQPAPYGNFYLGVASTPSRVQICASNEPSARPAESERGLGARLRPERAPARVGVPRGGCRRGTPGHDLATGAREGNSELKRPPDERSGGGVRQPRAVQ